MLLATTLLVPVLAVALLAGGELLPTRRRQAVRRGSIVLAPLTTVPAVLLALVGDGSRLEVEWMLVGTTFAVDGMARPLLLVGALLYGAVLTAVSWVRWGDTEDTTGALSAFLVASYVGNIGTYLAADLAAFYLSFTVMSFSAAGLVIHYRTSMARRATVIYLVMSVLSETALLAVVLLVRAAGATALEDAPQAVAESEYTTLTVLLLFVSFGIKAGMVPFHIWLPLAYSAAPAAAAAVLSGAMAKAGLVGWLRFLPTGEAGAGDEVTALGWLLLSLSLVGAFLAVAFGALQQEPKAVLAYSSISQMGFLGAVVAAGMIDPGVASGTAAAAVLYAVHHGFAKGALFLGVPVIRHFGRGVTGVLVAVGTVGAALALAGAPLTSGGIGKYVSKSSVEGIYLFGVGLDTVLPLVATGSVVLLARFGWLVWNTERGVRGRPDGELISWVLLCAAGTVVPWLIGRYWSPLQLPEWNTGVVWNAVWPILLGIGIVLAFWVPGQRGWLPGWLPRMDGTSVPPGDVVVAGERAYRGLTSLGGAGLRSVHSGTATVARGWATSWQRAAGLVSRVVRWGEDWLNGWQASGLAIVLMLGAAVVALLLSGWWHL